MPFEGSDQGVMESLLNQPTQKTTPAGYKARRPRAAGQEGTSPECLMLESSRKSQTGELSPTGF